MCRGLNATGCLPFSGRIEIAADCTLLDANMVWAISSSLRLSAVGLITLVSGLGSPGPNRPKTESTRTVGASVRRPLNSVGVVPKRCLSMYGT